MAVVARPSTPTFRTPNASFTPLATPSHGGSTETLVCHIEVQPGEPGVLHQVTRQQVYAALRGAAVAHLDGTEHRLAAGDTMILPPGVDFALQGVGAEPFEALVCAPSDVEVSTGDGTFPPPWAA